MPTPICFDMDGVLLEGAGTPPQVYADAADEALAELGADPTPAQRADLRRHDIADVTDRCGELGIEPERFWELKDEYASRRTHDRIRSGERGFYDDIEAIGRLADLTPIGLVTNNRHATAEFVAAFVPFEFDVVRGRRPTFADFRRKKPDPTFLADAFAELGAVDGLYVGDSVKDVVAADALELDSAFLRRPHNRDLDRPVGATYEIESLAALPDRLESL